MTLPNIPKKIDWLLERETSDVTKKVSYVFNAWSVGDLKNLIEIQTKTLDAMETKINKFIKEL